MACSRNYFFWWSIPFLRTLTAVLLLFQVLGPPLIQAQVVLDGTMGGSSGDTVGPGMVSGGATTPGGLDFADHLITSDLGKLIENKNLFHSFSTFKIAADKTAIFTGDNAIENVLSRVTGADPAEIRGTLGSSISSANLFLLSPKGIIFGENATLDIAGAFFGSTANQIKLKDEMVFTAVPGQDDGQLTSAQPAAFGFLGANPPIYALGSTAGITLQGLMTNGASVVFVGRDGILNNTTQQLPAIEVRDGTIHSDGGQISLASSGRPGNITFDIKKAQISKVIPDTPSSQNGQIMIQNNAKVNLNETVDSPAGTLFIRGGKLVVNNAEIEVSTINKTGGGIDINVNEATLTNRARIRSRVTGKGQAGPIHIDATSFTLDGFGSFISTSSLHSPVTPPSAGEGKGGDIRIRGDTITIKNDAQVLSQTFGPGNGGEVQLEAFNSTSNGIIMIQDFGSIQTNSLSKKEFQIAGSSQKAGQAGPITIMANHLEMSKNASIKAETRGPGKGGNITPLIDIFESNQSTLSSSSNPFDGVDKTLAGAAGNITISGREGARASTVTLANTDISTTSTATGGGGAISIDTLGDITLTNTTLSADVNDSASSDLTGASINVTTDKNLTIQDGTTISAKSIGDRNAGKISLTALDTLSISDNSTVSTEAGIASGGDIDLKAEFLIQLIGNSEVTSSVQGGPTTQGGRLTLDPQFIVIQDSRILARANEGAGGTINLIASEAIFIDVDNLSESISASAGPTGISGEVNVSTPRQNLSESIAPLPENIMEVAALYGDQCAAQKGGEFSSLTLRGRDRVPSEPGDYLLTPLLLNEKEGYGLRGTLSSPSPMAQRLGMSSLLNGSADLFSDSSLQGSTLTIFQSRCES